MTMATATLTTASTCASASTETAAELGITLGKPYKDIGSASRYAKKARNDFERLLADLRNDRFGADLLWLWESSRGSRRPASG
ncbi:hypothetical protein [Streptomyces sp. NPDC059176]|uniref:hypothetical protein n=1 Tax=Streptomyces sp. NPDC059176 TaxID=3346758 RepID=UPI0036CA9B5F